MSAHEGSAWQEHPLLVRVPYEHAATPGVMVTHAGPPAPGPNAAALDRYEAAVRGREEIRARIPAAAEAIDAAKAAYRELASAESAATDEVFAARAALRGEP